MSRRRKTERDRKPIATSGITTATKINSSPQKNPLFLFERELQYILE